MRALPRISRDPARPLLLDLFSGAGGAAMGYYRAGFDVLGVDIAPQPRYPFPFVQANALHFMEYARVIGVNAIHASPVCKLWSSATPAASRHNHQDMITPIRPLLEASGLPYVIENVPGAPLRPDLKICGCVVGLPELERERWFEAGRWDTSPLFWRPPCSREVQPVTVAGHGEPAGPRAIRKRTIGVTGHGSTSRDVLSKTQRKQVVSVVGGGPDYRPGLEHRAYGVADWRRAMGIEWMSRDELAQAIPPAYTEMIGAELLKACIE